MPCQQAPLDRFLACIVAVLIPSTTLPSAGSWSSTRVLGPESATTSIPADRKGSGFENAHQMLEVNPPALMALLEGQGGSVVPD